MQLNGGPKGEALPRGFHTMRLIDSRQGTGLSLAGVCARPTSRSSRPWNILRRAREGDLESRQKQRQGEGRTGQRRQGARARADPCAPSGSQAGLRGACPRSRGGGARRALPRRRASPATSSEVQSKGPALNAAQCFQHTKRRTDTPPGRPEHSLRAGN